MAGIRPRAGAPPRESLPRPHRPVEHSFLAGVAGLTRVTTAVRVGEHVDPEEEFRALFGRWQRGGSKVQLVAGLRDVVILSSKAGRFRDAAVLLAAILHASPDPQVHLEVLAEHLSVVGQEELADELERATAEGERLTLDEAVDLALRLVATGSVA